MAFAGLQDAMSTCEAHVKACARAVLEKCADDVSALDAASPGLAAGLAHLAATKFHTVTYDDAVAALMASGREWEFEPGPGRDLAAEHERWITDVLFGGDPVFVTDWPAEIKAFYMRLNDDGRTVAAMDLLVPRVGELAGGSAREERADVLATRMAAMGVDAAPLWWYTDLRTYGSVPHAGFGVGFERLVQLATGVDNIRDTTLFPRYPGHAEF
jgi:asparaginyl-tRNA synthetase